jgi:hypothetical protein
VLVGAAQAFAFVCVCVSLFKNPDYCEAKHFYMGVSQQLHLLKLTESF